MKFWRTTAALVLASAFSAATAFAALTPKAPAAAAQADSAGGACAKDTDKTKTFGLAMCLEMNDDTQNSFGNGFPWENSAFFFASFRNQFLYPSSTVNDMQVVTCSIESIGARANSFGSAATHVYDNFSDGPSTINVSTTTATSLVSTFSANLSGATTICSIASDGPGGPIAIESVTGTAEFPNGSRVSVVTSEDEPSMWCSLGSIEGGVSEGLLVDTTLHVGGGTGNTAWDVTSSAFGQGCSGPQRAFGSGSFANSQHITRALGVDESAFVWVFKGTAPPPPATVEQQIKEIVRLLLTPEGLRCSGLDLSPGDGKIGDDPLAFPNGASWDPIQPSITTGQPKTGDELVDGLRSPGWSL